MFGNLIKGLSRPDRRAESVDQGSRALTGAAIVVINYTSIVQLTEKWKMGLELKLGFGLGPGFRSGFGFWVCALGLGAINVFSFYKSQLRLCG